MVYTTSNNLSDAQGYCRETMEELMTGLRVGVAAIALIGLVSSCTSAQPEKTVSIQDSCINPIDISKQTIVSDKEIRFELRNGETWVNRLPRACPGLKFQQGFSWEVHGTLVCSNQETIRVQNEGTPCMLGEFARLPSSTS
jgi:hypothetical protein